MSNQTENTKPNKPTIVSNSAPNDPRVQQKLYAEIKKAWNNLSDEDIRLLESQPENFYAIVEEKQGLDRAQAQQQMAELQRSCGAGTTRAA